MKKHILSFIFFTLLTVIVFSCKKKDDDPTPEQNLITIVSTTPSSGLVDGQSTSFVVVVNYKLVTKDIGELNIGFNTVSVNSSTLISSAKKIVTKGIGTSTFTVNATPKNWGSKPFHVYVNLSEYPHASSWIPLASAYKNLSF